MATPWIRVSLFAALLLAAFAPPAARCESGTLKGTLTAVRYLDAARLSDARGTPARVQILEIEENMLAGLEAKPGNEGDVLLLLLRSGIDASLELNSDKVPRRAEAVSSRVSSHRIGAQSQTLARSFSTRMAWTEAFFGAFADGANLLLVDRNAGSLHLATLARDEAEAIYSWQGLPPGDPDDSLAVVDVNGDGLQDLLHLNGFTGELRVFEIRSAPGITEHLLPGSLSSGRFHPITAGDLDCTGRAKILVGYQSGERITVEAYAIDGTRSTVWSADARGKLFGLAAGRFYKGGCAAIVVAVERQAASGSSTPYTIALPALSQELGGAGVALVPGGQTRTDVRGSYRFAALAPGSYELVPFALGYAFRPAQSVVQLAAGEVQRRDFFAEVELPQGAPLVCNGFNYETLAWGDVESGCPEGYAVLGLDDARLSQWFIDATCCRLPVSDALTKEVTTARFECPEGSVAAGPPSQGVLSCRKIDSTRFALGPPLSGQYWGLGHGKGGPRAINKLSITAGLRHGLGRRTQRYWDVDGCVGAPPGALLTGMTASGCTGMRFRQLLRKKPDGTLEPVATVPECAALDDIFAPSPTCVR